MLRFADGGELKMAWKTAGRVADHYHGKLARARASCTVNLSKRLTFNELNPRQAASRGCGGQNSCELATPAVTSTLSRTLHLRELICGAAFDFVSSPIHHPKRRSEQAEGKGA